MRIIDTTRKLIMQFSGEQPQFLECGDHRIDEARTLINEYPDHNDPELEEGIKEILAKTKTQALQENISKSATGFVFDEDEVKYKGRTLSGELKEVLLRMHDENSNSLSHYQKFLDLLFSNPASHAVEELYDYIGLHGCAIDQDGWIIAWKSVDSEGWSWHGNTKTIVEKGETDQNGKILNVLSEEIRVNRNQVDDDRSAGCSFGLHAGSYEYASTFNSYGGNVRLMEVKIDPSDVVSIPNDCNCQKMRVCAYTPLSLSTEKIKSLSVNTLNGQVTQVKSTEEVVEEVVFARVKEDDEGATIREILDELASIDVYGVSPVTIADVARNLGFEVYDDPQNIIDWVISEDQDEEDFDEDYWDDIEY